MLAAGLIDGRNIWRTNLNQTSQRAGQLLRLVSAHLDTDVISIEAARSHGGIIETFETFAYKKGIDLGVYAIHSPRIPNVEEMQSYAERALKVLDPGLFWINPDCGLKTRKPEETIPALKNMVRAAQNVRAELKDKIPN